MAQLRNIVIVHEDAAAREQLASILERAGLHVKAVTNAEAERANGAVDAVLGDLRSAPRATNGHAHEQPNGEQQDLLSAVVKEEMTLRELSDLYTARILERVNGNKVRAARILGINRRTLYRRGEARRREAAKRTTGEGD